MPNKFQIQKHKDNSQKRKLVYWMCYWHTDRMCYYLYWQNSGKYIDRRGFEGCQRQASRTEDLIMSNLLPWMPSTEYRFNYFSSVIWDWFEGSVWWANWYFVIGSLHFLMMKCQNFHARTFLFPLHIQVWRLNMQRK